LPYRRETIDQISALLLLETISASAGGSGLSIELLELLAVGFGDCYLPGEISEEEVEQVTRMCREEKLAQQKRGTLAMADPEVLQPHTLEFYATPTIMPEFYRTKPQPRQGWPPRDTPAALLNSANLAHDNVRRLVRVNDRMRRDQFEVIKLLKRERWKNRLLAGAIVAPLVDMLVRYGVHRLFAH